MTKIKERLYWEIEYLRDQINLWHDATLRNMRKDVQTTEHGASVAVARCSAGHDVLEVIVTRLINIDMQDKDASAIRVGRDIRKLIEHIGDMYPHITWPTEMFHPVSDTYTEDELEWVRKSVAHKQAAKACEHIKEHVLLIKIDDSVS